MEIGVVSMAEYLKTAKFGNNVELLVGLHRDKFPEEAVLFSSVVVQQTFLGGMRDSCPRSDGRLDFLIIAS